MSILNEIVFVDTLELKARDIPVREVNDAADDDEEEDDVKVKP